jgi:hypothetical protein
MVRSFMILTPHQMFQYDKIVEDNVGGECGTYGGGGEKRNTCTLFGGET